MSEPWGTLRSCSLCLERRRTYVWPSWLAICGPNPVSQVGQQVVTGGGQWNGGGSWSKADHTHVRVRLMGHRKVRLAAGRASVRGIVATQYTRTQARFRNGLGPGPETSFPHPDLHPEMGSFSVRIYARTPSGTCDYLCRCWLWSWWPLGSIGRQFYVISQCRGLGGFCWGLGEMDRHVHLCGLLTVLLCCI